MKLFSRIYDQTMQWSKHRLAVYWLCFVSFIEAIFFPIPPDVMLIPMSMSNPSKAMRYAIFTSIASVVGGVIGYSIGYFAFEWVKAIIHSFGYQSKFDSAMSWFEQYGIAVVFIAGFISPIPYKIFTIGAGILQMAFLPFLLISIVSRSARFIFVAKLSAWGGEKYAEKIRRSIEFIGWATVVIAAVAYLAYQLNQS